MFKILVLNNKKDTIQSAIRYLLFRYELLFCSEVGDAISKLNSDNINMILVNLPLENGLHSAFDILKEWAGKKKTIALLDLLDSESVDTASGLGVMACVDKMDVWRLPDIVNRFLNKAETRILEINKN